jgi:hypothetical protein
LLYLGGEDWGCAPYSEPTVSGAGGGGRRVEERLGVPRRHVEGVHPRGGADERVGVTEAADRVRGGGARCDGADGGGAGGQW